MLDIKEQNKGEYVCEYGFLHKPNAETIAAFEEAEQLLADPNAKTYTSFAEILAEIDIEIAAEEFADVRH